MKKIYETVDGEFVTGSWFMWQFIKSTEQIKEYKLFKLALIKKELNLFN